MHFEVLVEDKSGSIVVDNALRAILGRNGENHTWRTHSYAGLGRLPTRFAWKKRSVDCHRRDRGLASGGPRGGAGGSAEIKGVGWPASGRAKRQWAEKIGPLLRPEGNRSPSFRAFLDGMRRLAEGGPGSGDESRQPSPSVTLPPTYTPRPAAGNPHTSS